MSKKFSITIIEAPDQNQRENPNNQFSNSEPLTFAQKVDYIKNINMTNNKQQTAVEWFSVRRDVLEIEVRLGKLSPIEYAEELTKAEQQAKEMEIAGKEMSYSDGYAQGYQRALDYISMSIENAKALISTEII